MDLLHSLREKWRLAIEGEGSHCPVCDRWGRIYPRGINKTMAHSLLWLCSAKKNEDGWVDVPTDGPKWLLRSNQLPTLRWWDLVESCENDDPKKKSSGMWRPTQKGIDFAMGKILVNKKVFTYKGEVEGKSDEMTSIEECFDDVFDYSEIMNSYFPERQRKLF